MVQLAGCRMVLADRYFASTAGEEKLMAADSEILNAIMRVATQIWSHRASRVSREQEDKADEADELWFELLKGLV